MLKCTVFLFCTASVSFFIFKVLYLKYYILPLFLKAYSLTFDVLKMYSIQSKYNSILNFSSKNITRLLLIFDLYNCTMDILVKQKSLFITIFSCAVIKTMSLYSNVSTQNECKLKIMLKIFTILIHTVVHF